VACQNIYKPCQNVNFKVAWNLIIPLHISWRQGIFDCPGPISGISFTQPLAILSPTSLANYRRKWHAKILINLDNQSISVFRGTSTVSMKWKKSKVFLHWPGSRSGIGHWQSLAILLLILLASNWRKWHAKIFINLAKRSFFV